MVWRALQKPNERSDVVDGYAVSDSEDTGLWRQGW